MRNTRILFTLVGLLLSAPLASAATPPTPAQALAIRPTQPGIDYTKPTAAMVPQCRVVTLDAKKDGVGGWHVFAPGEEQIFLRRFLDTDGDSNIDQYCYYKDGVEVYRDIDSTGSGVLDQFRWFGSGGSRWGIGDDKKNGIIKWKRLSPEELSIEVVAALASGNSERLGRVSLSLEEVVSLGLGDAVAKKFATQVTSNNSARTADVAKAKLSESSKWLGLSVQKPWTLPAKTAAGMTQDLIFYPDASVVVQEGTATRRVHLGALIKIGDTWKMLERPILDDGKTVIAASGPVELVTGIKETTSTPAVATTPQEDQLASFSRWMEKVESATTESEALAALQGLIPITQKLSAKAAANGQTQDADNWGRAGADAVIGAIQMRKISLQKGQAFLLAIQKKFAASPTGKENAAFTAFQILKLAHDQAMMDTQADYAKVRGKWIADLNDFITAYPGLRATAEAMFNLAMEEEFGGTPESLKSAVAMYAKIAQRYPKTSLGKKSAGAVRRLRAPNNTIAFSGMTMSGKKFDLVAYKNYIVLIHFWSSQSNECLAAMAELEQLQRRYAKDNFRVIGVCLDNDLATAQATMKERDVKWPQVFEKGGFDSPPANQLGVMALPTMILVGRDGKVVSNNLSIEKAQPVIKKLIQ